MQNEAFDSISKLAKARGVLLIAVSKKQSIEKIVALHGCGQNDFAENYVQEFVEKRQTPSLQSVKWHFIGRLQRNKVKQVVGFVETIQSVDRLSLLQAIATDAQDKNICQKVFLQVNLASEESKGGCSIEDLDELVQFCQANDSIDLQGLMALPPLTEDIQEKRGHFEKLKQLAEQWNLNELSMGTTHDYQIAIECGATMIRVGTALFGSRE